MSTSSTETVTPPVDETKPPEGEVKPDDEVTPPEGEELTDEQKAEAKAKEEYDALPKWARDAITKGNTEAANYRTRLRETEARLQGAKTPEEVEAALNEERQKTAALERELLITKVTSKYTLPPELAELLQGDDEKALTDHAKKLMALIKVEPESLRGGLTPNDGAAVETDPRKLRAMGRRH